MKRFRFQFETLEMVRRTREGEALRVLSVAQSKLSQAQELKRSHERALSDGLIRRENLGAAGAGPSEFKLETDFITGQKQRIIQAEAAIQRAKRGVEKALRAYLQAKRQTRVIEMLREKKFAEYKVERNKFELKQQDDLAVMRNGLLKAEKESA